MADQVAGGLFSPFLRRARLRAALPHVRGRVLDVGCGTGELARWCGGPGYLGVDIDEESLATARARHPACRFSGEIPDGETFDTIVGRAIIEHIKDPVAWLAELKPRLASGGRIVLTTPHRSMEVMHRAGSRIGFFSRDAADEHEVLFDPELMRQAAHQAGLEVRMVKRFLFRANQLFLLVPAGTLLNGLKK